MGAPIGDYNEMWWVEFVEAWAGTLECYCYEVDEKCAPCQFTAIRLQIERTALDEREGGSDER